MTTDRKKNQLEIEIKLRCSGPEIEQLPERLLALGFNIAEEESFEHNVVFDTPERELKGRKMLLRLRRKAGQVILTMKRPVSKEIKSENYKIREEIEVDVSDYDNTRAILQGLGYEVFFIYEKYRTEYLMESEDGPVMLMVDRTPIGYFVEIEAAATQIDRVAAQLGYGKGDYVTDNYYTLFRRRHPTGNMQFK